MLLVPIRAFSIPKGVSLSPFQFRSNAMVSGVWLTAMKAASGETFIRVNR